MKEIGLYIHIPFCKQKCYYCDFCSYPSKLNLQYEYVNSLIKELKNLNNKDEYLIKTIYIGGGTPSIINEENIEKIILEIKNNFSICKEAEITIEVNPGTVTEEKLKKYIELGINRISIGLQSSNNMILKEIGRIHNYEEFEQTYDLARKTGFKNINIDLMIGLPNQTINDVNNTLKDIINKQPEHISVYSLIIEEGTVIDKKIKNKELLPIDENIERKMYWNVKEILEQNYYMQYEISNFAKPFYESKHNSDCWKQKEYIGLGIAAHSYINNVRYSNTINIEEYIKNIQNDEFEKNVIVHEVQEPNDIMNEYMILGLRMINGINIEEFEKKFNINPINKYQKEISKLKKIGLININNNRIMLTKKGIDFANIVWEEFI